MLLTSCTMMDSDSLLEDALVMAGDNRGELEKVLEHYENDSLKLKAAEFLIRNMPGHYSYADTTTVVKYSQAVDSILTVMKDSSFTSIRDSVNACAQCFDIAGIKKVQDVNIVSFSYLIRNIDEAFRSWQEGEWARHLSFDDFCEYLLPYKVENLQLLDDWRVRLKTFLAKGLKELDKCDVCRNSTLQASRILVGNYKAFIHPKIENAIQHPHMLWETRIKVPFGTCSYYSPIALALLRSNGIPVAYDFTPHWACRRLGHSWTILLAENGHLFPFDAVNSLPGDSYRLAEKMAKAYRHTYAINEEMVELNRTERHVPAPFNNLYIKDVTREYIATVDVEFKTSALPEEREYAFLAIFGDRDWTPISYGKVKGSKVRYKDLGKNSLYMPFCYDDNGQMKSIGAPFVVMPTGKRKEIRASKTDRIRMALRQKYPVLEYNYQMLSRLDSCEFQASNDSTFCHYQTIHRISDCYGTGHEVTVPDSVSAYRYWRFYSTKPEAHGNVAELYFFDSAGEEIRGKVIGTEGSWQDKKEYTREKVFDGDILTFFDAPDGDISWVGMDFGRPVNISKFYYYPRSDGNAIQPHDIYELFYWDKGAWLSLGKKRATSPTLVYDNVPSGGVYLLRDQTRGQEERIFTYENDKQIWW